jgi:beta-galactosidase
VKKKSALWLDFENITEAGEFFSYGIGARTYGSIWPDRRPQPEMWQFKKSGQPVSVKLISPSAGKFEIENHYLFTNLKNLDTEWLLKADNEVVEKGKITVDIEPQKKELVTIPFKKPLLKEGREYRLFVSFKLKEKTLWAGKGFEIAWEQLDLPWYAPVTKQPDPVIAALDLKEDGNEVIITGNDFRYVFNKKSGSMISFKLKDKELIHKGPEMCVWRAPLANETDEWGFGVANRKHRTDGYGRFVATEWYSAGLDRLDKMVERSSVEKESDGSITIDIWNLEMLATGRGGFRNHFIYNIKGDGSLTIDHAIIPDGDMPSFLPRAGTEWILDNSMTGISWYGRGPQENYPDRKSGYKTDVYTSKVSEMYEPYLIPQDYGLRCENRWVRLTDKDGAGIEFRGDKLFNFSAHEYSDDNLTKALYTYQLKPSGNIVFNFDYATSGVGCTALSLFTPYQVMPQKYEFRTEMKPVR